jgi:hypothetical protein
VSPYRPALQLVHTPAPPTLNLPSGHISADALADPGTQKYPAVQLPLHAADGRPAVAPYVPAGHALHAPAPPTLYRPAAHISAVALVDPAGQAYPALQLPLQPALAIPLTAPYVPARHAPLQLAVGKAATAPYRPTLQFVQVLNPATLNLPAGQGDGVEDVDPAWQLYPAAHGPLHDDDDRPLADPYVPKGHIAVHSAVDKPVVSP